MKKWMKQVVFLYIAYVVTFLLVALAHMATGHGHEPVPDVLLLGLVLPLPVLAVAGLMFVWREWVQK